MSATGQSRGSLRVGVDLGGTKIEAVILDSDGSSLARQRISTPRHDYAATVHAIATLVETLEQQAGGRGTVGVAIPGTLSALSGRVKNANSTWLIGRRLDRDLAARLARPVRLANDADCFAVSEATDGAGAGARCVFGVILGTGVGGGIVVDGRLHTGRNGIAGEWGHTCLPWPSPDDLPAPPCYCGRAGCIETYLCGPALARDHAARGGRPGTADSIAAAAAAGDAAAAATIDRYAERLARGLSQVIDIVDPDVIVLGGGLSRIPRLYETVPALWQRHVFSDRCDTGLLPARHGDSSGVRGAAWLWAR